MSWHDKWLLCLALAGAISMPASAMAEPPAKTATGDEVALRKFDAFSKALLEKTEARVKARLENLEDKASHLFDQGTEIALAAMTATVRERLAPYKNTLFGAPPEADAIYADGKKQFEQEMKALSIRVAIVMADEIAGAKREIKDAEARVATEQAKLPKGVRARAAKQVASFIAKLVQITSRAERDAR